MQRPERVAAVGKARACFVRRRDCRVPQQDSGTKIISYAAVVEQADTRDLKSLAVKSVPVRSRGAREAPPVADAATRASGRGRQGTSLLRQAKGLPGTATGQRHQNNFICRCGGTGRHKGLKIPRRKKRTGSIPVSGTISSTPSSGCFLHSLTTNVCATRADFPVLLDKGRGMLYNFSNQPKGRPVSVNPNV